MEWIPCVYAIPSSSWGKQCITKKAVLCIVYRFLSFISMSLCPGHGVVQHLYHCGAIKALVLSQTSRIWLHKCARVNMLTEIDVLTSILQLGVCSIVTHAMRFCTVIGHINFGVN